MAGDGRNKPRHAGVLIEEDKAGSPWSAFPRDADASPDVALSKEKGDLVFFLALSQIGQSSRHVPPEYLLDQPSLNCGKGPTPCSDCQSQVDTICEP